MFDAVTVLCVQSVSDAVTVVSVQNVPRGATGLSVCCAACVRTTRTAIPRTAGARARKGGQARSATEVRTRPNLPVE